MYFFKYFPTYRAFHKKSNNAFQENSSILLTSQEIYLCSQKTEANSGSDKLTRTGKLMLDGSRINAQIIGRHSLFRQNNTKLERQRNYGHDQSRMKKNSETSITKDLFKIFVCPQYCWVSDSSFQYLNISISQLFKYLNIQISQDSRI